MNDLVYVVAIVGVVAIAIVAIFFGRGFRAKGFGVEVGVKQPANKACRPRKKPRSTQKPKASGT